MLEFATFAECSSGQRGNPKLFHHRLSSETQHIVLQPAYIFTATVEDGFICAVTGLIKPRQHHRYLSRPQPNPISLNLRSSRLHHNLRFLSPISSIICLSSHTRPAINRQNTRPRRRNRPFHEPDLRSRSPTPGIQQNQGRWRCLWLAGVARTATNPESLFQYYQARPRRSQGPR